ncbi:tail fiber domain-containing protein [Pandoraea sp. XJJ-1]|uniref:tail fiber domain-containing protein n=1 Tax=Pandoraea sp. XJJ-1 TaxID=3002643 RepID=UPI00227F0D94|nr:tail fiber domain-containing protein [Pandoraea sp. XJJ-1]WAL81313.1 tail fiber domain-containing protein [Pandoraea sp. XJJ-1]
MRHSSELPDLPLRAFKKALFANRPVTLEGKGGGDAPQAPDPYVVANATTQTNQATAAYNKALNLNNSSGPFGSQQSNVTGIDPITGAPIYNTNISASAPLQGLINSSLGAAGNSNNVLNGAMFGLGGLSSQISPTAAQDANQQGRQAAYAAQTQYLDPRFSQEQTSLESQLANQGLTPGSQAYDNAMKNFNLSKNQAYSDAGNQSILTGSQIGTQMLQNQLATVGQQANLYGQQASLSQLPYSQLSSLAGLIPGNSGTAQSAASPANIAQSFQNQYQGQLNSYNSDVASQNSTTSGLFGLGSAGLMMGAMAL